MQLEDKNKQEKISTIHKENIISFSSINLFRKWLEQHFQDNQAYWIKVGQKKEQDNNKDTLNYIEIVYELLCFGWIDGQKKKIGKNTYLRISKRVKNSFFTEQNRIRCELLERQNKMTQAGRQAQLLAKKIEINDEIYKIINSNETVRKNFYSFPKVYQRIRLYNLNYTLFIRKDLSAKEKQRTTENFIKNTKQGKMYGNWSDNGRLK